MTKITNFIFKVRLFITGMKSLDILDKNSKLIKANVIISCVPRINEMVYLEDFKEFYRVLNVTHRITNQQSITIIIDKLMLE